MQRKKKTQLSAKVHIWKTKKTWPKLQFLKKKKVIYGSFSEFFLKQYFIENWGFLRCIQFVKTPCLRDFAWQSLHCSIILQGKNEGFVILRGKEQRLFITEEQTIGQ